METPKFEPPKAEKAGTTRLAFYTVGVIVLVISVVYGILAWKTGDKEMAATSLDTLKIFGLLVLGYFFGQRS